MVDYESIICRDVGEYWCQHGELPKAIFVSRKLLNILAGRYDIKAYDTPNGIVNMYHGIEVKPYCSDKLEYYLVVGGRELD